MLYYYNLRQNKESLMSKCVLITQRTCYTVIIHDTHFVSEVYIYIYISVFVWASSFKLTSTAQIMSAIQATVILDVKTNVIRPMFL